MRKRRAYVRVRTLHTAFQYGNCRNFHDSKGPLTGLTVAQAWQEHLDMSAYTHSISPRGPRSMTDFSARSPRVLVIDDDTPTRDLLCRLLRQYGYVCDEAVNGEAGLAALETHRPDLVLLDVQMPGIDGFEVCRRIKRRCETRLTPVVLVTGLNGRENKIEGIQAGADDFLSKPFDPQELIARVGSLVRLKRYTDQLESAESIILTLALTVEARDPYTEGHCQRLAAYATALGGRFDLDYAALAALRRGGYLHDVGKIGIPDAVLLKTSGLTAPEVETMRQHPIIGERLCGDLHSLAAVRPIIRHHHERRDGSGYPDRLRGDDIPLLAQIVAIVDTYDAMTTTRPYRAALSPQQSFDELTSEAAQGLHRHDLVREFIALGREGALEAIARNVQNEGSMATTTAAHAGVPPLSTGRRQRAWLDEQLVGEGMGL